jgi:hypothetical protein
MLSTIPSTFIAPSLSTPLPPLPSRGPELTMGYTHYWKIPSATRWQETWPQLVSDTRLIVENAGVPLTGGEHFTRRDEPNINEQLIYLNGYDEGHEPFVLDPFATEFSCCKTARRKYDVVVAAILLRASQLAGDAIEVRYVNWWGVRCGSARC